NFGRFSARNRFVHFPCDPAGKAIKKLLELLQCTGKSGGGKFGELILVQVLSIVFAPLARRFPAPGTTTRAVAIGPSKLGAILDRTAAFVSGKLPFRPLFLQDLLQQFCGNRSVGGSVVQKIIAPEAIIVLPHFIEDVPRQFQVTLAPGEFESRCETPLLPLG